MIDNFPQRMERFLDCISQVYFQQESFDAIVTGNDKSVGKKLMSNYEEEMASKKQQTGPSMPSVEEDWEDNRRHCERMRSLYLVAYTALPS